MRKILILTIVTSFIAHTAFAQLDVSAEAKKMKAEELGWKRSGGFGLNLDGFGIANPRAGAGVNRVGFGGLITGTANKIAEKSYWENALAFQLGAQRLGRDVNGFQKSLDLLRINSRMGWKVGKSDKLYAAVDVMAQTQILETYEGNYLKDVSNKGAVAKFLSPLNLQVSPGIDYRPNAHLSFFYSPASLRMTYVGDDAIAQTLVNDTPIQGNEKGKNNKVEVGSNLIAKYENKYLKDRIAVTSVLNLYSNYLKDFENVDVTFWRNTVNIAIFKGLSLELLGEMNYDNDIPVIKDANNDGRYDPNAGDRWGRGGQYIGGFFLKYNRIF